MATGNNMYISNNSSYYLLFQWWRKTKIAVSEKVENKNTIISANGEDEEKIKIVR